MKKVFNLFLVITLCAAGFVSCSDDDDEGILRPTGQVQNLSFTDTDYDEGKIGGTLSWTAPSTEENITDYVIYLSDSSTEKGTEIETVKAGTTSYTIEDGTDYKAYINIVVKNEAGEASSWASLAIRDNTTPVVEELQFTDIDSDKNMVGGTISWKAPGLVSNETINGYVIYLSDNSVEKGTKIGETTGERTYELPKETPYQSFIHVAVILDGKELDDFAGIAVQDIYLRGFYVLNRGNLNSNNSKIGYYDFDNGNYTSDLFLQKNGQGMGDSAEEILIYGSKMYVTVYQSNTIMVLDMDGNFIQEITPSHNEPVGPRCMAGEGGKVFISYYKAHSVAVMDTISFNVEKEIPVGRYPENVVVANGNLYVANSGGLDYDKEIGYGNTVSVIDLETLSETSTIEVALNPTLLKVNSAGDVYVISMGNYGDVKNTLQKINASNHTVDNLGNASIMSLVNDKLYTVYAQWGEPTIDFKKYDALTGQILDNNFIKDGTTISSPYSIDVNPLNEDIYIGDYNYVSTSDLYIFSSEGKLTTNLSNPFDTDGYNTVGVYFRVGVR